MRAKLGVTHAGQSPKNLVGKTRTRNCGVTLLSIRPLVVMSNVLKTNDNLDLFTMLGLLRTKLPGPEREGISWVQNGVTDACDPLINALVATGDNNVGAYFLVGDYESRTS